MLILLQEIIEQFSSENFPIKLDENSVLTPLRQFVHYTDKMSVYYIMLRYNQCFKRTLYHYNTQTICQYNKRKFVHIKYTFEENFTLLICLYFNMYYKVTYR